VQARFAQGKVDGLAAGFEGTWKRSTYRGTLTGTATKDAQLTATISSVSAVRIPQSRAIQQTFQFSVGTGAFNRSFPLPATGFFPGKPIVVTDVASPLGLPSGRYTCVLKARGLVVYEVAIRVD
jgi:hypothetical protein